jgi:hypothetical protein
MIPLSAEFAADAMSSQAMYQALESRIGYELTQMELDRLHGPRLRPGRSDYDKIMKPIRRRDRLREALRTMGRPAGPFTGRPAAGVDRLGGSVHIWSLET